jgi:hypothetical protein
LTSKGTTMHSFIVNLWADQSVVIEIEDGVATVDGEVIADGMLEHCVEFGFRQLIRDAAAGQTKDDAKNAMALKKIAALIAGTLRQGTGGGARITPLERQARLVADREVRAAVLQRGLTVTQKAIAEAAEKHLDKNRERIEEVAAQELADLEELETVEVEI